MRYKVIKLKPELYNYIKYIGKRDFGNNMSAPLILYKILRRYENKR